MSMIVVADAGSTKTDWHIDLDGRRMEIRTDGLNPAVMSVDSLQSVLEQFACRSRELGLRLSDNESKDIACVYFYGAGCTDATLPAMSTALKYVFGAKADINVNDDLTGAARALFGNNEGIACILGTGSNSGVYDGRRITEHIPPMGYILGDEGSGAVLGRMFLNALYKGRLGQQLKNEFERQTRMNIFDIIEKVYRGLKPNAFLASMSAFIAAHIDNIDIEEIVVDNFCSFFKNNVCRYTRQDLDVGVVGSIGVIYKKQLEQAACIQGVNLQRVMKNPIDDLAQFHFGNANNS